MSEPMKVPYDVVKRMLDSVAEHYKHENWRLDDCYLTFEYIIGSCFPSALHTIKDTMRDLHTQGYIQGRAARLMEDGGVVSIQGVSQHINTILTGLAPLRKEIQDASRIVDEAPNHGWSAEEIYPNLKAVDQIEYLLNELTIACQNALGANAIVVLKEDTNET